MPFLHKKFYNNFSVLALAKRFALVAYLLLLSVPSTRLTTGLSAWADSWWVHRSRILLYTGINVGLTTATEIVCRSLARPSGEEGLAFTFLVMDANGTHRINRQSLINIWMTFFASLVGGPVFFLRSRRARFLFFVLFGIVNSAISQSLSVLVRGGTGLLAANRLAFDAAYHATVKFGMFEWFRVPILRSRKALFRIGGLRAVQDFSTTALRVSLLNLLGFRG